MEGRRKTERNRRAEKEKETDTEIERERQDREAVRENGLGGIGVRTRAQ